MKPYRIPKWLEVVFIGAIFALIGGGYAFFRVQQQSMRAEMERNLLAVAQVKIDQITSWRENQLAEGVELMSSVYLKRGIADWLQRRDVESEEIIRARMQALVDHYHYKDILLLTPDGRQLMSYSGQKADIHPEMTEAFTNARERSQPILSALHIGADFDFPHIFLTVPMALEDNGQGGLLGYFLFVIDANDFLFPLIQSWPLPSETAETLLVQRDGDAVLYLNELRHLKDTALSLRIPLTELDVPASKAIHGATGIMDGQDYRDIPVIAAVLPVPDTDWFMISKIDKTEALVVWRTNAVFIILMILGAVGTAGGFTGILWQRSAQHRLEQSEKKFRTFYESSPTAISLNSPDGRYIGVNRAYCEMTGYTEEEIVGKPVTDFTHPEDRKSFEERISTSLGGKKSTHRFEKRLVTKKGEIIWVSGNTNLISDSKGTPLYFLSHMLNITNQKEAEEELRLSEERFRLLAESAPEGIFVQTNLEFVYVNPAAVKLLGAKNKEELLNTPMLERFVPEVRNEVKRRIQETLSGKSRAETAERRCIRMNGEEFDAEVSASYFSWQGNEGSLVFIRDISERKQVTDDLAARENLLDEFFNVLPIGLWLTDKNGKLIRSNLAGREIWGAEPLVEMDEYGVFKARRIPGGEEISGDEWALAQTIKSKKTIVNELLEIDTFDSKRKTILNYTTPVLDKKGDLQAAIIVNLDITDKQKAEDDLRRSEELLKKAQEVAQVGSWVWHIPSGKLEWSDEMFRIFGIDREAFNGDLAEVTLKLIHPDDREKVEQSNRSVKEGKRPIPLEYRIIRPDGDVCTVWAEAGELVLDKQGNPLRLEVIVQNITEDKKAQQEIMELNQNLERRVEERTLELREVQKRLLRQERLAAMGQLVGSVSHELRNPLGVISNSIYILTSLLKDADQKTKEYLEMISEETRRSEKIITDMLDFSKVRTPDARAFRIDEIIHGVLERTKPPENIELIKNMDKDLPMAYADPIQITQVLTNLVAIAYQAMKDGGQLVISASRQTREEKIFIQVKIKDSGEGMTKEVMGKIFEPLFTTKPRGIGLGLALSKSLIETNGGSIQVESQPGLSSTFIINIPAYAAEEK